LSFYKGTISLIQNDLSAIILFDKYKYDKNMEGLLFESEFVKVRNAKLLIVVFDIVNTEYKRLTYREIIEHN